MTSAPAEKRLPKVSVGMPVWNGEKTLPAALDSIIGQSFSDFELIISDNASTDGTSAICRQYEQRDCRIRYVRQPENTGAARNFEFVLKESNGDYFMWAADDDVWSEDFLESNLSFLEKNPDYIASVSPVRFEDDEFNPVLMGDAELTGPTPKRFESFFTCWHANCRLYSLIRMKALQDCPYFSGADFFGSDWAIMLHLILQGKTNRHTSGWLVRGHQGFSNSGKILEFYRTKWIHWFLPFYELSKATMHMTSGFPWQHKIRIAALLARMNYQALRIFAADTLKKSSTC